MSLGDGITAGEEGDFMTLADEFFGEIRNDAFGASVKFRRHTFIQWGNLGNSHKASQFKLFGKEVSVARELHESQ
jgi:hypothetical protein